MSRRICLGIAALILPLGVWGGTARAHAARTRIAVLGVSAEQLRPEVREKIASAVAGGLAASGADVVDSAATAKGAAAKGISDCETPTCRIAIADATGARYLMRGSVQTMGRNYTVHLEMIDGTTGTVIGVREDRCEICTENEAYETASVTASALKAEVVKRPAAPGDGADGRKIAVTDVAYPAVKDSPAASMVSAGGSTPAGDQPPPRMRGWAWAAIGAGRRRDRRRDHSRPARQPATSCMRRAPTSDVDDPTRPRAGGSLSSRVARSERCWGPRCSSAGSERHALACTMEFCSGARPTRGVGSRVTSFTIREEQSRPSPGSHDK